MRKIFISDISVRRSQEAGNPLPFRVKIEVAKLLSKLGVSVIETSPILDGKTDYFLIKSLSSAIANSTISVSVDLLDAGSPAKTWEALSGAAKSRLQVPSPVSPVQMEYFSHKKPAAILQLIAERVKACAELCPEVEFVAEDFGRADEEFLFQALDAALKAGAKVITVSDLAGNLLPDEFYASIKKIRDFLPADVKLGVYCSNDLHLADACAIAAVRAGADEIKTMAFGNSTVALGRFPRILNSKSDVCGASCEIKLTELRYVLAQIRKLGEVAQSKAPVAPAVLDGNEIKLTAIDDKESVLKAAESLGYELNEEDGNNVYEAFKNLASSADSIGAKEIDAIVASVAFQVPPTYLLENYMITSGNLVTPTCHLKLRKGDEVQECVCLGDGPVDAAFLAINQLTGTHYELDDFQIKAVTEGREALGETVVRLRSDGKVYSGRGVSKDVVSSSVMAYLNAINKIVYEQQEDRQ
ncbi:MAG: hypothetical protein IJU69_00760 [Bacteroidales bacterium]|nr:hypothetical protein [Bacteroidales bacterium]